MALVGVLWAALFIGYLRLTPGPDRAPSATQPESLAALATATDTPGPQPPDAHTPGVESTPTVSGVPTATLTPLPTEAQPSPTSAITADLTTGELPTAVSEPAPVPDTVTPTPMPTETLVAPTDTPPPPTEEVTGVSFSGDVSPILERRCVKCHGGERTEEGLILKTHTDVIAGSWNGPVIEPGDAEGSFLVEQIISGRMPKKGPRLLPSEIRIISDWIDAGAPDN